MLWALHVWDKFRIRKEFPIKNASITGILDFAIIASKALFFPIVCVIKAQDHNMLQGLAQAYLQLRSCYELGKKAFEIGGQQNMKYPFYFYGTVTTVKEWYFIRYNGETWVLSQPMFVKDINDKDGIKQVSSYLYNILMYVSK